MTGVSLDAERGREPNRLRVLLISNMYPSVSAPKYGSFVEELESSLMTAGVEVSRVVSCDPHPGAFHAVIKYSSLAVRALTLGLRCRFDAVHAHYLFPTGFIAWLPSAMCRRPLIVFSHGSDVLLASRRWPIGSLTRWTAKQAALVVVPSQSHARIVIETFGLDEARVKVAPIGVDLEAYSGVVDRGLARRTLGMRDRDRWIGFVGALDDNKGAGLEWSLEALLSARLEDVHLLVVGEGQRRGRLVAEAKRLGVTGRVRIMPFLAKSDLMRVYAAVDAVLVPSRRESLGLVALEAQASGTPVVAAAVGGLVEHVLSGITGELFNPADPSDLVRALSTVLERRCEYRPHVDPDVYGAEAAARKTIELTREAVALKHRES